MDDREESSSSNVLYDQLYQNQVLKLLGTDVKFAQCYGIYLKDEYFESQPLRVAFQVIRDQVFKYDRECDQSVLMAQVEDLAHSRGYVEELTREVYAAIKGIFKTHVKNDRSVIDQLIKFVRRQEMKAALLAGVDILEKDGDYEQVLKSVDHAVSLGSGSDEGLSFNSLKSLPDYFMQVYDPAKLIKTGFPTWDACLNGGMAPGELHCLQAAPKQGKSSTGVSIGAHNVRAGKAVYHMSGELGKEAIAMKYATNVTGISEKEILTPEGRKFYNKKIEKWEAKKPKLFINNWPEGSANILQVRAWIIKKRAETGIDPELIILDYDDCFIPVGGITESLYDNSGMVYTDMIQLASYFNCPVFTMAQPQREVWEWPNEAKIITFQYLAHSAKKAHKCWSLSSLNFPDESSTGILYVDLNRRGESKTKIRIEKDLSRSRLWEN